MTTIIRNESTGALPDGFNTSPKPLELHEKLPHYAPTPLIDAPPIAERLGLSRVLVKDESQRFGMPSFKLLGASWATFRALVEDRQTAVQPALDAGPGSVMLVRDTAHCLLPQPSLMTVSETNAIFGTSRFFGAGPFRMRPAVS